MPPKKLIAHLELCDAGRLHVLSHAAVGDQASPHKPPGLVQRHGGGTEGAREATRSLCLARLLEGAVKERHLRAPGLHSEVVLRVMRLKPRHRLRTAVHIRKQGLVRLHQLHKIRHRHLIETLAPFPHKDRPTVNQRQPSALAEQREGEAPIRRGTEHRPVLDAAEPTKGNATKLPVAHDVGIIKVARARLLYSVLIPSSRGHTLAMASLVAGVTLPLPKHRRKTFLKLSTPVAHLLILLQAGPEHNPVRVEQLGRPNPISDDGLLRKGPFRVASSARHRAIFRTQQSELLLQHWVLRDRHVRSYCSRGLQLRRDLRVRPTTPPFAIAPANIDFAPPTPYTTIATCTAFDCRRRRRRWRRRWRSRGWDSHCTRGCSSSRMRARDRPIHLVIKEHVRLSCGHFDPSHLPRRPRSSNPSVVKNVPAPTRGPDVTYIVPR